MVTNASRGIKVSVITTVWNVGEWLDRNIQAFLNQTLKDSELILINDCSPDNSAEIIAKYDSPRIKVVNNEVNVGAGISRQIGLDNSCGEYIIFVDGDDWLEEDCLERMYDEALSHNADMVSCNTIQHNDYGMLEGKDKDYIFIKEDYYNFINNKLIKRDIWSKTHYSPLRFREDVNTLCRCLEFAKNPIKIEYAGYHYNLRPNSLTSTHNIACKSYIYNILAAIENVKFLEEKGIVPSARYASIYNVVNIIIAYGVAKKNSAKELLNYQEECGIIEDFIKKNNPLNKRTPSQQLDKINNNH